MTEAEVLLGTVAADHHGPVSVAISSPGGCGKTAVLSAVAASYAAAGVAVWDAEALAVEPAPAGAVLIDDAHRAEPALLHRARQLVDVAGTRLFVAYRPWPPRPEIALLVAAIRAPVVHLDHLDHDEVGRRAAAVLANPPSDALVELLAADTGGLPRLVDEVLASWAHRPPGNGDGDGARDGNAVTIPTDVLDRLRRVLDRLAPGPRALLHAVAIGADLAPDTVAPVLGIDPGDVGDVVDATWATGYLLPDGQAIPLVADALIRYTPPERTRAARQALLHAHHEQRRDALPLARALAGSGVRDRFVADLLVAAADGHRATDPSTAAELYAEAIDAGAVVEPLALRRADVAARTGMFDVALRLVDPILADPGSPAFLAGLELAATVMAHRGLLAHAADLYGSLGRDRITTGRPMAALALMATGRRAEAAELMAAPALAPTMAGGVRSLVAQGVWASIDATPAGALSMFSRATALAESAEPSMLLPDTPAALAALVAIHAGDPAVAESVLRRAIERDLGGDVAWARHRLLLAWVAMLKGRFAQARQLIDAVVARAGEPGCSPRDEVFIRGLQLGIARRTSDAPALVAAWQRGREALFRHPVDLFVLLPVGEFAVSAARLRESARVAPHLEEMWRLLRDLGEPAVWSALPHWCGVQAAILHNRPADVEPHATALVRGAATSPFAAALAAAGRAWMEVLVGDVDPAAVQAAARRLQDFGLPWDASRLLGQAAAHSSDRRATVALLQLARATQGQDDSEPGASSGSGDAADVLSAREREVAELLVQGRTYREIGQRLYIAPKTVEHHVARMKQRIGSPGRSELLAQLRVLLDRHGA